MKNLATLVLFVFSTSFCSSQVKNQKKVILLGKKEYIDNQFHLGESGFLLSTEKRLFRYSPTGDLLWERESHDPSKKTSVQIVASNDGSNVFTIEGNFTNLLGKTQFIRQIDSQGNVKDYKIEGSKDKGEVISVFSSSSDLCYLSLVKERKKTVPMLNRFESSTMTLKTFSLAVPESDDSYWYYLGQWNGLHVIANKDIDRGRDKYIIHVAGFNDQGQIVKSFTVNLELDNRFVRIAMNAKVPNQGWYEVTDNDFYNGVHTSTIPGAPQTTINQAYYAYGTGPMTSTTRGPSTTSTSSYLASKPGAITQVSLDSQSGMIYVYGLFGPDDQDKITTGFYLHKYNLTGEVQWKLQHDEPKLVENKFFKRRMDGYRQINFMTLPQEKSKFMICAVDLFYAYTITEQGKVEELEKPKNKQEVVRNLTGFESAIKKAPAKSNGKEEVEPLPNMSSISSIFISTKTAVELEFVNNDVSEVHLHCHGCD
jgi:hypothetical protein